MKLTWVLLVAAAVCQAQAGRIIGGQETTIEQFPAIVQVEFRSVIIWYQSCGANIVNSKYLVSAAHCFWGLFFNIDTRRIRAGTSIRGSGGTVIELVRRLNHPTYRPLLGDRGLDGDISLVELATPLDFSNVIQTVPIPPQGFELPDGLPVVHAGWGDLVEGAELGSTTLQEVTIYTIDRELCTGRYANLEPYPGIVTENMICAGILDVGGKDACQGDSGGPLYYDDILVGVVSWGHGCANETYPGLSARVSSYTQWILDNTQA